MKHEFRRWSGWAVRLAASLAVAATCSTTLAQAPIRPLPLQPAGQPPVAQPPSGMSAEQQRVVAEVHGVGCIPLDEADNTMTPPRLFGGVVQCLALGDYDKAARLSALAGIYLRFDVARLVDRAGAGVAGAFPMLVASGASVGQTQGLRQGKIRLAHDPAQLQAVCNEVTRIGMPAYYPTYMIAGGMGELLGEPKGWPLRHNFDAAGTWNKLQATYLQCQSVQGGMDKIKKPFSKAPADHTNDVTQKIAELPDPTYGAINFHPVFSPNGSVLASVGNYSDASKIDIWDWRSRRLLRQLNVLGDPGLTAEPLAFSSDGRFLAQCSGGGDFGRAVRVWNTATWEVAQDIADTASWGCHAVAFSADSRLLLRVNNGSSSLDRDDVVAYSTATWQKLWGLHDERIKAKTLAVSPTGSLIAIGGVRSVPSPGQILGKEVSELALLDLQQRKYVRIIFPAPSNSMSWSPDGTRLAVLANTEFEIYDMPTGQRLTHQNLPYGVPTSIRYSPNGKYLVINSFVGSYGPKPGFGMQMWDGHASALLQTNSDDTSGVAFSPDSRYIALAKFGRIEIWQFKQSGSGDSAQR